MIIVVTIEMFIKFANTNGEVFEMLTKNYNNDNVDPTIITTTTNYDDDDYNNDGDETNDTNIFEYFLDSENFQLGRVLTYPKGICIIDRDPNHTTTQLNVDDILELLRQLIYQMYMPQSTNIKIYLPRMYSSMIKQAECQNQFQNILEKIPSPTADDMVSFVCNMSRKKMNENTQNPQLLTPHVHLFHV